MGDKRTMNGAELNGRYCAVSSFVSHDMDQVTKTENEEMHIPDTNELICS